MWLAVAVGVLGACAPRAREAGREEPVELSTIAAVGEGDRFWQVVGEPIARGRRYAVVDDRGYLGTVRAQSEAPCLVDCVECCANPEWTTAWVDAVREEREGLVLAIGPVDGRLVSARRELPAMGEEHGSRLTAGFVRSESREDVVLARFAFDSEPSMLEARGRHVDGARVVELRVRHHGTWRVVSRTPI